MGRSPIERPRGGVRLRQGRGNPRAFVTVSASMARLEEKYMVQDQGKGGRSCQCHGSRLEKGVHSCCLSVPSEMGSHLAGKRDAKPR
jgi:hypothetical protein